MRFRSFRVQPFLSTLIVAMLYPIYAYFSSERSLLRLIDAMTIMGFVFLIIGVVHSLIRHGDFDIVEYVAKRSLRRGDVKPFDAYKSDKKEERKDSFNYPFLTSLVLFAASAALAVFVY